MLNFKLSELILDNCFVFNLICILEKMKDIS